MIISKMRLIVFVITLLSLCACKNTGKSLAVSNERLELIPEPDKDLREEYEASIKESSKDSVKSLDLVIPEGYILFDKIRGDLNSDGIADYVLVIKGTDSGKIVVNSFDKKVDRNHRGILIYLTENDKTILTTKNLNCFLSENEDGGVYFPPQLSIDIVNGKLQIHYNHGRYGFWKYTFRYQNSDFEMIAYSSSQNNGPIVNREISMDFLKKKKLTRENVNQNTEDSGDEIFEDSWEDIIISELYSLSEITQFSELDVNK